jgi:hypothetical protein
MKDKRREIDGRRWEMEEEFERRKENITIITTNDRESEKRERERRLNVRER